MDPDSPCDKIHAFLYCATDKERAVSISQIKYHTRIDNKRIHGFLEGELKSRIEEEYHLSGQVMEGHTLRGCTAWNRDRNTKQNAMQCPIPGSEARGGECRVMKTKLYRIRDDNDVEAQKKLMSMRVSEDEKTKEDYSKFCDLCSPKRLKNIIVKN